MLNRHPLVRVWDKLRKDERLVTLMNEVRKSQTEQPLIYTLQIPEDYRKTENAPFMRLTQIMKGNALNHDGGSSHYRFLFAVETFGRTINDVYQINQRVVEIIESINGVCIDSELQKDEKFNLYHEMLSFNIILTKKE
ncbi:hypothetical protein [Staphylococcus agnetis]|uniref:hypothetical protein n=1 Tax=Staphylococcus agnetis TaxID=985762 RepID=UPI00071FC063|nr:hypothetical protein [Staphylococcus agnetis]ALN76067.1 hypothetical protein EP23_01185 [Staphylococcus agnetis]NJI12026.1 hypothetical protein [Staphylococcus agnetis]